MRFAATVILAVAGLATAQSSAPSSAPPSAPCRFGIRRCVQGLPEGYEVCQRGGAPLSLTCGQGLVCVPIGDTHVMCDFPRQDSEGASGWPAGGMR